MGEPAVKFDDEQLSKPGAVLQRNRLTRRQAVDRLASLFVCGGGVTIIVAIVAILVVIASEVLPLFDRAAISEAPTVAQSLSGRVISLIANRATDPVAALEANGELIVYRPEIDSIPTRVELGSGPVVAAAARGDKLFALNENGELSVASVRYIDRFSAAGQTSEVVVERREKFQLLQQKATALAVSSSATRELYIALVPPQTLIIRSKERNQGLLTSRAETATETVFPLQMSGEITALALDERGLSLFAGTSLGEIVVVSLRDRRAPKQLATISTDGSAITVLGLVLGDQTLVSGSASGAVQSWMLLRTDPAEERLAKINTFSSHTGPVSAFARSPRSKSFVTAAKNGELKLHHSTTGGTLATVQSSASLSFLTFAVRGDLVLGASPAGAIHRWNIENRHPEISWRTLFRPVWYEGYNKPEYVWQSGGASDEVEPKLSLIPLIFGTLKGTFYALVFSVPIALLAALYSAQFMHPSLKAWIKPVIEIMAALPSVVLGFVAGIWLAPRLEQVAPGVLVAPIVLPAVVLLAVFIWHLLPERIRNQSGAITELLLIFCITTGAVALSFAIGSTLEQNLLDGDFRGWVESRLNLGYDQRNCLVVGIAMGFAVIPLIYTIAEDTLSSVPKNLVAGSLALGATRWQTALRIVLPTASPGVFSAVMIGFGRAVGETMIVMMATGNTPLIDWSPFNGFRALSANIAVELPEAAAGETLYRVLFLAALLLFIFTFVINTISEMVRGRLRKQYGRL